ncbi:thiamine phosphate phosphatase-like protein [Ricinus communis]|uniref:thiamine phosphate phosphatase-like protein n=1 Tax=Ricinus communis TaxID=3988 RepID=UPI00201AA14B|nr:thiamine phosphate phosphatase-like protein [Ricinus communis]
MHAKISRCGGAMARVVVVFDFDKTLIDCDSDNWVVEQLGVDDTFLHLLPTLPWNSLMDQMMIEIHSRKKTIQDIAECLRQVPLHPRIISAIQSAHASGFDLRIVSDANTFFIETILKHYGLMDCFSEIYTNPTYVDTEERLRISQYHDPRTSSHGCTICPPNMCKGIVMDRIRASVSAEGGKKRFIYVGDGSPDFCATLKLKEEEFVMPRKDFPLWEFICSNKNLIKAKILEWSDGEELGTRLLSLINTILIEEKCSVRTDLVVVPVDCKFQTGSISSHDSYTRDVLQVPR